MNSIFPFNLSNVLQGLRVTALCGAIGTCTGAWIKVFSVHPDLFYVGFIGVNFDQKIVIPAET